MSVKRRVEVVAFNGRRMFKKAGNIKIYPVTAGTGTPDKTGTIIWSSATGDCFLAIDTSGTGTQINA